VPYIEIEGHSQLVWISEAVQEIISTPFDLVNFPYDLIQEGRIKEPKDVGELITQLATDITRFREVRALLPNHTISLDSSMHFYRARPHFEQVLAPWPPEEMCGNPDFPYGRANLNGQQIFYMASSDKAAMIESRAAPNQHVTIALASPRDRLTVVSVIGRLRSSEDVHDNPFAVFDAWMQDYVADPKSAHYMQTQLFSCIVRAEGFDGVAYSSSRCAGARNYALFDANKVTLKPGELRTMDHEPTPGRGGRFSL
jgi:hypothetical protein